MVTIASNDSRHHRSGFTLIELIYAIVIIGIAFLTLPVILINNSRNVEQNLEQEAIMIAATKMGQILSYAWDDASINPNPTSANTIAVTEVLDIATGDLDFNRTSNLEDFRRGHFIQPLHRRMTPHATPRVVTNDTALGLETGETVFDDIDDFDGNVDSSIAAGSQYGYKNAYDLTTCVDYVDDGVDSGIDYSATTITFNFDTSSKCPYGSNAPAGKATNLKLVQISVDKTTQAGGSTNEQDIIVLRAYSANIGETDYYKRTY